jgi:hypothetical protein
MPMLLLLRCHRHPCRCRCQTATRCPRLRHVLQQNSYTQNIVDFDCGIGVFSTNPSTDFSDGSTDFFGWYDMQKTAHD